MALPTKLCRQPIIHMNIIRCCHRRILTPTNYSAPLNFSTLTPGGSKRNVPVHDIFKGR